MTTTNSERLTQLITHQVAAHDGHCPICCAPVAAPYRSTDETGAIIAGCVSVHHEGQLEGASGPSKAWHDRPWAVEYRQRQTRDLRRFAFDLR